MCSLASLMWLLKISESLLVFVIPSRKTQRLANADMLNADMITFVWTFKVFKAFKLFTVCACFNPQVRKDLISCDFKSTAYFVFCLSQKQSIVPFVWISIHFKACALISRLWYSQNFPPAIWNVNVILTFPLFLQTMVLLYDEEEIESRLKLVDGLKSALRTQSIRLANSPYIIYIYMNILLKT